MRHTLRLVLATLLFASSALRAQQQPVSEEIMRRFAEMQRKPSSSWTEEDYDEVERLMLEVSRQIVESGLTAAERSRLRGVAVRAVQQIQGPPAWIDSEGIALSSDALGDMTALGMYLGHDIYVENGNSFPVASPAIAWPFSQRAMLPLMSSLDGIMLAQAPFELLKCNSAEPLCAGPQGASILVGTTGFLLAHEIGHLLLGHRNVDKKARPLEEELAADRKAWSILSKAAPDAADDMGSVEHRVRIAIQAGPLVVLRWLSDGGSNDAAHLEIYQSRFDALNELVSEDVSADVLMVAEEQPAIGRMRSVEIRWRETPDELYVNGTRLAADEVVGKTLRLFGKVRVFARRGDRFSFTELGVVPGSGPEVLELSYRPLGRASVEPTELKRRRQWFELFLASSTPDLRPRSASGARDLYEALAKMGVGELIDPQLSGLSTRRERFLPNRWRTEAQPLGTWRPYEP